MNSVCTADDSQGAPDGAKGSVLKEEPRRCGRGAGCTQAASVGGGAATSPGSGQRRRNRGGSWGPVNRQKRISTFRSRSPGTQREPEPWSGLLHSVSSWCEDFLIPGLVSTHRQEQRAKRAVTSPWGAQVQQGPPSSHISLVRGGAATCCLCSHRASPSGVHQTWAQGSVPLSAGPGQSLAGTRR